MKQIKTTAIVLAAGKGSRMKANKNKVYLELLGRPVITYALEAFEKSEVDEVIMMVSPGDEDMVRETIVEPYGFKKVTAIIPGGRERFESVYFGIRACKGEVSPEDHYILIHDNARPFIQPEQINECIEAVQKYKACALAVPAKDTIRLIDDNGFSVETPQRKYVWITQTPQCFVLSEAREAFEKMMAAGDNEITDDVMVLERYGNRQTKMILGVYENIKLTTPDDMVIGESILKRYLGDKE